MTQESLSRSNVLEIREKLIRTPSVNPSLANEGTGETAIALIVPQWFAANGVKSWLEEADVLVKSFGRRPGFQMPAVGNYS